MGVPMTNKKRLTRAIIVQTLVDALKPLDYVHALYEGGAVSYNRLDEWSDIDAYAVVNDNKVDETFLIVEKMLKSLSPIERKIDLPQTGWSGVSQAFYRLEDASEYLIIDFVVLKLSASEKFLEPKIHGPAIFYFNKNNKIQPTSFDKEAFINKINSRIERLQARFDIFNSSVQKEINRGNYLEAIDLYHNLTLAALVEALRIKHNPLHYDFRMRYVHYELPHGIVEKLEDFYSVSDEKDLQKKYLQANKWFHKAMSEINRKEIKKLVNRSAIQLCL
jgi:hypothetical protein